METRASEDPLWVREPFRVSFPLGIAAAVFGLLLWPLHYAGWWELYPAMQHPLILIFGFGAATLLAWGGGLGNHSVELSLLLRLVGYQGFLLLPIIGVGSTLFARFFQIPGAVPSSGKVWNRGLVVWTAAALILLSFVVEAYLSARWGNLIRLAAFVFWAGGALPGIWTVKAPGTRAWAWALRFGLIMLALAFLCRVIWPSPLFAFQHLLFLGGFCQVILLTADRVVLGHCDDLATVPLKSRAWQWIVWLMVLTAATRATADLAPSTRVSHHIYAVMMLVTILLFWMGCHAKRLGKTPPDE